MRYQKEKWLNQTATPGMPDFILALDHLKAGFNIPKIFRKMPTHFHERLQACHDQLR